MNFPENLRYTKDHEWIKLEGNTATIGITEFAQRELGDIVYVEIETVGKTLMAEAIFGSVEAVKTVSDLYLPISGTINEVNPVLASSPELVNSNRPSVFRSSRPTDCHLPWNNFGNLRNTVGRFCGSSLVTTSPTGLWYAITRAGGGSIRKRTGLPLTLTESPYWTR